MSEFKFYQRDLIDQRIIEEVSTEFGITKLEGYAVLEDYFRQVKEHLSTGKTIRIPSLGTMLVSNRKIKKSKKKLRTSKLKTTIPFNMDTPQIENDKEKRVTKRKLIKNKDK